MVECYSEERHLASPILLAALVSWGGPRLRRLRTPRRPWSRRPAPRGDARHSRGDAELLPIDQVIAGLGVSLLSRRGRGRRHLDLPEARGRPLQQEEPGLGAGRSAPALGAGACSTTGSGSCRWTRSRACSAPLLEAKVEWRPASRVLLVGNVAIPRVTVTTFVTGDVARVVLEASEKVPFRVRAAGGARHRLDRCATCWTCPSSSSG